MKALLRKILPDQIKKKIRHGLDQLGLIQRRSFRIIGNKLPHNAHILNTSDTHTFFGYYDISPFHKKKNILLATQSKIGISSPHDENKALDIGYYDLDLCNPIFIKLSETISWNWQQGCRLQWLNYMGKEHIIYNVFLDGQHKSIIYDFEKCKTIQTLDMPIYSIDPKGQYAITTDFSRLHFYRRGYGYSNQIQNTTRHKIPPNNGIWKIDITNNRYNLVIDYLTVVNHQPLKTFINSAHYFNHLSYSPSGDKFLFFHLWTDDSGKRSCRLMTADFEGNNLQTYAKNIRASHYCWLDNNNILLTGLNEKKEFGYYLVNTQDQSVIPYAHGYLTRDGHPTSLDQDVLLTDSYPDSSGYQELFTYDNNVQCASTLGKFYSPVQYQKELRCDLHPRISHDKKWSCVDMIYKNRRAICLIPIGRKNNA